MLCFGRRTKSFEKRTIAALPQSPPRSPPLSPPRSAVRLANGACARYKTYHFLLFSKMPIFFIFGFGVLVSDFFV